MVQINSYLTFKGNCREAMTFYKNCLGGELHFQTLGESPLGEQMQPKMKACILHATLTNGNLILMGSDMVTPTGLIKGNAVSLSLNCSSEKEIKSVYKKLSTGGQATYPLEDTFWGALFGGLTDKFGNNWLLNFDKNSIGNGDKELQKKISEAFANGNMPFVSEHLAENIKWNILGSPPIIGKEAVIEVYKMAELQNFPVVTILNIVSESDCVVIESTGEAKTTKGKQYNQIYCDIFRFKEGKLQEITTYLDTALSNTTA
jgi:PhnB protein